MAETLILSEAPRNRRLLNDADSFCAAHVSYRGFDSNDWDVIEEIEVYGAEYRAQGSVCVELLSSGCKTVLAYLYIMKNREMYPEHLAINVIGVGIYALECLQKHMARLNDNDTLLFMPRKDTNLMEAYMKGKINRYGSRYSVRDTEDRMRIRPVIFLAGYVKSGKTYVLNEIKRCEEAGHGGKYKVEYHDIRTMQEENVDDLMLRIIESIENSEDTIFLIDNITYSKDISMAVEAVCCAAYENRTTSARVVIAGDRFILNNWAYKYLFDTEGLVTLDYMDHELWNVLYCHCGSEKGYEQYLDNIDEFYGVTDLTEYLENCLDTAKAAERCSISVLYNNDSDGLTADILLDAMYSVLMKMYEYATETTPYCIQWLEPPFNYELTAIKMDKFVRRRIKAIMQKRNERFMKCSEEEFKKVLIFLMRSGIITLKNTDPENNIVDRLLNDCFSHKENTDFKESYFRNYIAMLKHPLFFTALMKRIIS